MAKKKQPAPEPDQDIPPLRLEWRSPAELAENPHNWRRHPTQQISALTDVIADVGWAGACLFNEATGRLIDGHARKKVALDQGADKIPVLVGSWTEAQEKTILATLDPLAALAESDTAKLDALLREVQTSSEAVAGMLTELAGLAETDEQEPEIKDVQIPQELPRMSWVLIGIPTVQFGSISSQIESIASVSGVVMETTSNEKYLGPPG